MKATTAIPYITLPDLGTVLDTCRDAGYINEYSMRRIMSNATDYTQELQRKSKEATAMNLMLNRCRHEAANLHHALNSRTARKRNAEHINFKNSLEAAHLTHEENLSNIRSTMITLQEQCQRKIDGARIELTQADKGTEEWTKLTAAIRSLEGHMRELKRKKEEGFADEFSRYRMERDDINARYRRRLLELSEESKAHLLQKMANLDTIREAKPEQLAAIYDDLHGQVLAMAREGGES